MIIEGSTVFTNGIMNDEQELLAKNSRANGDRMGRVKSLGHSKDMTSQAFQYKNQKGQYF
jgi:hypothetical protein